MTDLTHINSSGTIAAYDYTYDADNRITEFASPEGVSLYNYDKTDQLTNADHNYQTNEEYSYGETKFSGILVRPVERTYPHLARSLADETSAGSLVKMDSRTR